jgi:hypothetical protein
MAACRRGDWPCVRRVLAACVCRGYISTGPRRTTRGSPPYGDGSASSQSRDSDRDRGRERDEESSSGGDGDGDEQQHGEIRRHSQVAGAGCDSPLLRARGQGIWAFAPTIDYYHIINTEGPCLMFDSSPNIPRRPVPASTLASSCARAAARRETVPWGLAPPIGTRSLLACTCRPRPPPNGCDTRSDWSVYQRCWPCWPAGLLAVSCVVRCVRCARVTHASSLGPGGEALMRGTHPACTAITRSEAP